MKKFFENLPFSATQGWRKYFPDSSLENKNKPDTHTEIVLCTSSEITVELNNRLTSSVVYVVYPDHPWIDVRYATELYLLPFFEPSDIEDFFYMFDLAKTISSLHKISVILLTPEDFSLQPPSTIISSQAMIAHFTENIALPSDYSNLLPIDKIRVLENFSARSPFNEFIEGEDKTLGIIACGEVCGIVDKISQLPYSVLKLKHYPLCRELAEPLYYNCDEILVLEQGLPYVEQRLRGIMGIGTRIRGKLNRIVPAAEKISLPLLRNILNF